jgi:hypothetical protein
VLTIIWNLRGFHLINVLEKSRKFNAGYYIAEIFEPLSQWCSIEAAGNKRKLLVHADNARPHTAKLSAQSFNKNRMKSAPHPSVEQVLKWSPTSAVPLTKVIKAGSGIKPPDRTHRASRIVLGVEQRAMIGRD